MRTYRNMRLRDCVAKRGPKAQKEAQKAPKEYPLESGDWSSCDESDEDSQWDEVSQSGLPWASS